tara:strand:+ start:357 stop:713 length:357 start_codon:yes stop_codon:yes gene_type:complete
MDDFLFRTLNPNEEKEFKAYAHDEWSPNTATSEVWHPVVRDEWSRMDKLSKAVQRMYLKTALYYGIDHMATDACNKTINKIYSSFETLATETELDVWQNIDQAARATIVYKTVQEYFQ